MFSKIGDLLQVNATQHDGGRKDGSCAQYRKKQREKRVPLCAEESNEDAVVLSVEALRSLINEQPILQMLDRLENHGFTNLPLHSCETPQEAVARAASYLSSF